MKTMKKAKGPKDVAAAQVSRSGAEKTLLEAARRWTRLRQHLKSTCSAAEDARIGDAQGSMQDAAERLREADYQLEYTIEQAAIR